MDPFSAEGELVNIHTAFIQGQYQSVIDDYEATSFSPDNQLPIEILQHRARCALGHHDQVLTSIPPTTAAQTPDLGAMLAYASHLSDPTSPTPISTAEDLARTASDNLTVQLLCGTVLARAGHADQALHLLAHHQGSLDAVALTVQIHLAQHRADLALKEAASARSFAQDALLVNLAEAWIAMRQGGDHYQKAFYVFEELAQAPASVSAGNLVAQAVSEMHLGRTDEAGTALAQAVQLDPGNAQAIANRVVLDLMVGKGVGDGLEELRKVDAGHEMLADLAAKKEAFRNAMGKYNPKFVQV
jgi:coatomer protein complex subunit epsilon